MGGLIFLLVMGLWFALCVFLARKMPGWIGVKRFRLVLGVVIFPVLLVTPVIDEIVGMRQFEQLCKERSVVYVSPEAGKVRRAIQNSFQLDTLAGYWVKIQSQPVTYTDLDTGKVFISFQGLHTTGGRIAGIAMMGGTHSCWPTGYGELLKKLNLNKLLEQGKKS